MLKPLSRFTPKDSIDVERGATIDAETSLGYSNYGYTKPNAKKLNSKQEAVDLSKITHPIDPTFKGIGRRQLSDYKFNSGRTPEHLLLYADGKISLSDINSADPKVIAKIDDLWKQHGNQIKGKLNDKNFTNNLAQARKEVQSTTAGYTLANPHPKTLEWNKRIDDMNKPLDYSALNSKQPVTKNNNMSDNLAGKKVDLNKLKSGETAEEGDFKFFKGASGELHAYNKKTGVTKTKMSTGKWDLTSDNVKNSIEPYAKFGNKNNLTGPANVNLSNPNINNIPSVNAPASTSISASTANQPVVGPVSPGATSKRTLLGKTKDYLGSNEGKYRMSQLGDVSKDLISPVLQYANNMKAQNKLDRKPVPPPILAGMVQANKFNNNVELSAINNNLANDNAFAQSKFTDSQTAAAMRGVARTNALGDTAKSNANKNNIDMQSSYDASKVNLGTTMQNNALISDFNKQNMIKQLSSIQAKQGFRNTLLGGFDNAMKAEQIRQDNETKAAVDTAPYSNENREYLASKLKGKRIGLTLVKNGGVIPKGKSSISKMYC
jgi:hypothetical protein